MKKKIKISLILSLAIIFGCFSNVFAVTNQNNKINKIAEAKKSVRLLDNTNNNGLDQYTKLLMHMDDNNFKDECGHAVTNNNVTLDTNNKKFGNGSASFNGSSYLSLNNYTDLNFLHQVGTNGKWTISFWLKLNNLKDEQCIFDTTNGTSANSGIYIGIDSRKIYGGISNSRDWIANFNTSYPNDNDWHYIEISYDQSLSSNNFSIFIDGVLFGQSTKTDETPSTVDCYTCRIGQFQNNYYLNGYIDEFRISKGIAIVPINNIELNKTTDSLILKDTIKGTDTLAATVTPDNVSNKNVIWTSSDEGIVKVDQNGNITAQGKGTATITATTTDGTNLSKSCVVTVTEPTIITLDKTTYSINVGDTGKIMASVTPAEQAVAWSSSDNSIATVDGNGNIKGVSAGTAVITATTADGKTVSCTVTVKDKETGKSKLTLYMNDKTIREFYLTQDEIDDFVDWYTLKVKGEVTVQPYYLFNVSVPGKSSSKKSYVWFMKIESFEVE